MKKFILFTALASFLFLGACTSHEEKIPGGVLDEAEMQKVLIDVLIAESYISQNNLRPDSAKIVAQQSYEKIFRKHNTNREQFYRSMDYYSRHPDILEKNFQPIIDSLSTMEANTH